MDYNEVMNHETHFPKDPPSVAGNDDARLTPHSVRWFSVGAGIGAVLAAMITLATRSEPASALLFGYSLQRLVLALGLTFIGIFFLLPGFRFAERVASALNANFRERDRVYQSHLVLILALGVTLWCLLFSWLFVPHPLRPVLIWAAAALIAAIGSLRFAFADVFRALPFCERYRVLPRWRDVEPIQRRTIAVLTLISVIYLLILLPSNLNGTESPDAFARYGGDEVVIYPILMDVMTPGETFSATLYHLFIYEDYHYGYPFYAASTLLLTPVRLLTGASFAERVDLNLPLLRLGISVIPLVLACWVIVFLFTRFRRPLIAALTLVFLLLAPGSLQNNQGFWHPDGLNLLFVCLALYFLQRDDSRFGRNFFIAAVFVGLSVATRVYGVFFAPAVGAYLIQSLLKRNISWRKAVQVGLLFIAVMVLTAALSSPYLFRADARDRMIAIIGEKSGEMAHGYEGDDDPRNDYRPGWDAWAPAFEDHYVRMFCFWFLWGTLVIGSFVGRARLTFQLTLLWSAAITAYLVFLVAVKSTQYVLPALLPVMGAIFALPLTLEGEAAIFPERRRGAALRAAWVLAGVIFMAQLIVNLAIIRPRFF